MQATCLTEYFLIFTIQPKWPLPRQWAGRGKGYEPMPDGGVATATLLLGAPLMMTRTTASRRYLSTEMTFNRLESIFEEGLRRPPADSTLLLMVNVILIIRFMFPLHFHNKGNSFFVVNGEM